MNLDKLDILYPTTTPVSASGTGSNTDHTALKVNPVSELYYESPITTNPPQEIDDFHPIRDAMVNPERINGYANGYSSGVPAKDDAFDYFKFWIIDKLNPDLIKGILDDQGYFTEATLATILGFESPLQNPFYFLYGDLQKYKDDMEHLLIYSGKMLADEDPDDICDSIPYKRIKAVTEALDKAKEEYGEI